MSDQNLIEYRTTDIYLASYLLASGFENYRIEKKGKQAVFIFEEKNPPTPNIFLIEVDNYYTNNALIPPKKLFNAFKELKIRIFNQT